MDALTEILFLMTEDATMLHNAADNIYYEQQQKSTTNTIWTLEDLLVWDLSSFVISNIFCLLETCFHH